MWYKGINFAPRYEERRRYNGNDRRKLYHTHGNDGNEVHANSVFEILTNC